MFHYILFIYVIGIPNGRFVSHASEDPCTSLNCTFDAGTCCWSSFINSDFEWKVYSDGTALLYPGPKRDHTSGGGDYMYALVHGKSEVKELTSPKLKAGTYCLSIWYQINGTNIAFGIWKADGSDRYAYKTHSSGDMWQESVVEINSEEEFEILIRGGFENANSDSNGVIAIDDVAATNTPCPEVACTSLNCTFDTGVCCWTQKVDNKWNIYKSSDTVGASYTGPKSDHTNGNGDYMYALISESNEKAELISPSMKAGTYCLSVWYNISGTNLLLKVSKADHAETYVVKSNSIDSMWENSLIEIMPTGNIPIAIQGTKRTADEPSDGSIAIDDVGVSESRCPLDCSFENGWCAWKNSIHTSAFWNMRTDENSNYGHYLHILKTKISVSTAKMVSSWQEPGLKCLSIKFRIQGATDNKITISVERYGQDDEWKRDLSNNMTPIANVEINSTKDYKVILAGEVQSGKDEDIYIENIASITGACPIDCYSSPCFNGATCIQSSTDNTYRCECAKGRTGKHCTDIISTTDCNSNPCLNGATCVYSITEKTYTCVCSYDWTGEHCTDIITTTEATSTAGVETSKDSTQSNNKRAGTDEDSKSPILYIVVGGVALLLIVAIAVVLILVRRRRKRRLDNMGNRQRKADNANEMDEANEPMYELPDAENPDDCLQQRSHNGEDENEYSEAQYSHTGKIPETKTEEDAYNHLNQARPESNADQTYSHIPNTKPNESVVDQTYSHIPSTKPNESFVDQTYSHIPNTKSNESVVDQIYSHIPNTKQKRNQINDASNIDEESYDLLETSINDNKTKIEAKQVACDQVDEYEHIGNKNKI